MKVTVTEEGMSLRKTLLLELGKQREESRMSKNCSFRASPQEEPTFSTLPMIKSATEVSVKMPKIHLSKDFHSRYMANSGNSAWGRSPTNIEPITAKQDPDYIEFRLNKALGKAKNIEEMAKVETRFRKVVQIYSLQMARRQVVFDNLKQTHERLEKEQAEKVDRFKLSLPTMTMEIDKVLGTDTRRVRKKERVERFQSHRYSSFWNRGRVSLLSIPRWKAAKFADIQGEAAKS